MNALYILSLMVASAMGAPVIVAPFQPGTFLAATPQLQFVQQPAFLAQAAVQQEEAVQEPEPQQDATLRDPNNPTTDVFLHSGFPLIQSSVQSPLALTSSQLTRVGITTSGQPASQVPAQSAQLVAAPAQAQSTQFFTAPQQFTTSHQAVAAAPQPVQQQPQLQQQTAFTTFPAFQTASLQQTQPAQVQVQSQPAAATTSQFASPFFLTAAQQQPSTLTAIRTVPFTFQTVATQ